MRGHTAETLVSEPNPFSVTILRDDDRGKGRIHSNFGAVIRAVPWPSLFFRGRNRGDSGSDNLSEPDRPITGNGAALSRYADIPAEAIGR